MKGYETAHIDELEVMPVNNGEFVWRPVRRRFGISGFGSNAYSAEKAGQRVIEEHFERDGHEEMYVVLRGLARFTLGDDELDAGPGTLVFVRPGTRRGAIAAEDNTFVLAVGAKPGIVFEPSLWEDVFAAYSYAEQGKLDEGRELVQQAISRSPEAWQGYYNSACIEARFGDPDKAIAQLKRSLELDNEATKKAAENDSDFDSIRDRPDYPA
ncbi:MAG TPA: tetratricopeptide repeat protein [Gaiellaceae bacterium]|nr:tetratricopeptide repeat protein [Gaiellaceae bacterium]